jgi:protoporphyrin/coproporphyrin ferrochelatase
MPESYDAVLVLSFGGPEKPDDVIPFLENVLRDKNVPRQRLLEVAEHYYLFDGRSPINGQNRELIEALRTDLKEHGIDLPVYWGNRNWHPFLASTLAEMRSAGVRRALAFVTSAFSSYSGCRQYLDDIERARAEIGAGAPIIDKLRGFYNHPGFIATMADRVRAAFAELPVERRISAKMIFTAHSIPVAMAAVSPYLSQLEEACRLTAAAVGQSDWTLAFQSRSGSPSQPWLEPDIGDALRRAASERVPDVVVVPIGFVSDHMEVLYDLDTEASALAASLGINMVRAGTAGSHPRFVTMIRELIMETMDGGRPFNSCHTGCCRPESAL